MHIWQHLSKTRERKGLPFQDVGGQIWKRRGPCQAYATRRSLENVWLMFDHVKHVQAWTTMVCHLVNAMYYKIMTIVVCDM
jgi:hypothetical protein